MNKLKYLGYSIVFQEVPNEVSLAINISGCPYRCRGCHSEYLWEYKGNYLCDDIYALIKQYDGLITCVCFMGGDQNPSDLLNCFHIVKQFGLKICLYSGNDNMDLLKDISNHCDYVKIGHYDEDLGGLDSSATNQKFYSRMAGTFINTTYLFQRT